MSHLPAYRVTYSDGSSYCTSMAAGVDLERARAYFLGAVHVEEDHEGRETRRTVVVVEAAQ